MTFADRGNSYICEAVYDTLMINTDKVCKIPRATFIVFTDQFFINKVQLMQM